MPELRYGNAVIRYSLERRERKTLAIEVHPDSSVRVKAPMQVRLEEVQERVLKRAAWIGKQQRLFAQYPPPLPRRQYISGEGFRYLGRQYRLKVLEGEERVRLYRGRLEVATATPTDRRRVEALVSGWYRSRAESVFRERYGACIEKVKACGITAPAGYALFNMPKRWGSCTKEGKVLLNPLLVSAPKECIDYVIVHELCHLKEHNHSSRFYALLDRAMPDWEERQSRLNRGVELQDL